jgi:RNA polymerase sigma-70 factor (ECF subfamily)
MNTTFSADISAYNKQALVGIYEKHSPGIYRYAYRLLGERELSEECVSETFSRFLLAIRNGRGPNENVQGFLYRIAHNWITDHYRRRPPVSALDEELHEAPEGNPAETIAKQLENERVRAALLLLPEDQRKVIMMRVLDEWSHEEVAEALGKTVEATRALQYRALQALRRLLIDQEEVRQ